MKIRVFTNLYIRYCFVFLCINFSGNEVLTELGSGSKHQIGSLKKVYPNLAIMGFELPESFFLCEVYLTKIPGAEQVGNSIAKYVASLESLQRGTFYLFLSWMYPLVSQFKFDLFWNSASFGEMKPNVVEKQCHLNFITG